MMGPADGVAVKALDPTWPALQSESDAVASETHQAHVQVCLESGEDNGREGIMVRPSPWRVFSHFSSLCLW